MDGLPRAYVNLGLPSKQNGHPRGANARPVRRRWSRQAGRWLSVAVLLCAALPLISCARETVAQGGTGAGAQAGAQGGSRAGAGAQAGGAGQTDSAAQSRAQARTQGGTAAQPPGPFRAVVDHVDDGDTLSVRVGTQVFRIRLTGVDAPEIGQRFGVESRNRLRALIFDRTVDVRPTGVDQYGRLLACPIVDGQNVCETMVADGWAWHYRQYSSDARLAALEKQAREARRGLWSDVGARPPWERRAEERERASGGAAPGTGVGSQAPRATAVGPFHGNVKSRVYHAAGCPDYNCASCTAVFPTREAAEAAGYRPHRECVR